MTRHATDDREIRGHPTDAALAAWVDERSGGAALAGHLDTCAPCRDRVASLEGVVAAVAAAPAPLDPAAAAASRQRILAALAARPEIHPMKRPARRSFRIWWIPTAAAAALALFLVQRAVETDRAPVADATIPEPTLPVVALAEKAAEDVAVALETEPQAEAVSGEEIAVLEAAAEPLPGAGISDYTIIEEFESLEPEDQEAVLMELAASEFQL
jgi:hypothetical protein